MSKQYEAKQEALAAYPNDKEKAVSLFIGYIGSDLCDIEYELGMSCEEYIFGKKGERHAE